MRKLLKNNKIFLSAIVSFCLLFFALVGVKSSFAAIANGGLCNGNAGLCVAPASGNKCPSEFNETPTSIAPDSVCSGTTSVCCTPKSVCALPSKYCTTATTCASPNTLDTSGAICLESGKEGKTCCNLAPPATTKCSGKAPGSATAADGECKTGFCASALTLTEEVATKKCVAAGENCCKIVAESQEVPCTGTIPPGTTTEIGVCQKPDCGGAGLKITPTTACATATPNCCKPSTANSPTKFNYCTKTETGKTAIGGVCSATADPCPATTPQDVTAQLTNNECTAPNTKCCKVADAAAGDQPGGAGTGAAASDIPEEAGYFAKAMAWLISALIWLFGAMLLGVVECIVKVSQFNKIVNSYFVVQGWIVLRDLVNMFFVLGLLFIAFVTVLKIEKYQWQKLLPKLLIMAVVVNFSRTICGLMIDFFQVMMFTFVNAYKDIAGENLYKGLGLRDMWDPGTAGAEMGSTALILGRLLGLIYVIVALIVTIIFLVILVFRIIMLWVLVVFSPLAFFSAAFNGISSKIGSYWSQWFKQFIEYCMVGPLLAFFLWLSILSLGSDYTTEYSQKMSPEVSVGQTSLAVTQNKAGRLDYIMKYVLGILMLVAGLKFTADTKVMGSSMAGKAASKLQDMSLGRMERAASWVGGLPGAGAGLGYKYAGMTVKEGLGRMERGGGVSGRLAKWARLAGTKEGRQTLGERTEARIQAHVGGQKVALQEQRQKEQDRYAKQYKLAGVAENPDMMKKELAKATGDRKQALMDILGDEGKMTKEIYDQALANGDFKHLGIKIDATTGEIDFKNSNPGGLAALEKKSKKWEKAYQARTHLPIAFSPFTRNEVTNAWEPTGAGTAGKKKKLKDIEDGFAGENSANLRAGILNGDFMNTGDLATNLAHGAAFGRSGNNKTVGEDALNKANEMIEKNLKRVYGTDDEQLEIAEKDATAKGLSGTERQAFIDKQLDENEQVRNSKDVLNIDRLKNLQKGVEVSSGKWEVGSGAGTIGYSNSDLAKSISALRERPEHDAAKAADGKLMAVTDRLLPGLLKQFQSLPIAKQNEAIRQHMSTVSGKDASSVLTDAFLDETRKFSSDIINEGKARDDLAGPATSAFRQAIALARKKDGGSQNELNQVIAGLLSTQAVGQHKIDSEGMSSDVFQLGQFKDWADQVKDMIGASAERQREIILGIATNAQAAGYFNGDLPKFKENEAGSETPEPTPPPPPPPPTAEETFARENAGRASSYNAEAPQSEDYEIGGGRVVTSGGGVVLNEVNNITQNLSRNTEQIINSGTDPLALKEAFKNVLGPMMENNMDALTESLGSRIDQSVKDEITAKFAGLGADIAQSNDYEEISRKLKTGVEGINTLMGKLENKAS
jgi:hypothetical protein